MRYLPFCLAMLFGGLSVPASSQPLAQLAKQMGCISAPVTLDGTEMYKCETQAGSSYFNCPACQTSSSQPPRRIIGGNGKTSTPANFPRVDSKTQRERDDVRKRVLTEELATEIRMKVESEIGLKSASAPLLDETPTSPKYLDRMAKLRQTLDNHNKNIQALYKELDRLK